MKKYVFLGLLFILFSSCKKETEVIDTILEPECLGESMIGKWSTIDSVEIIFLDFDSIANKVYYSEINFYDNGIGNQNYPNIDDDYFFQWVIQCEPDVFTMSIPFSNQDSLFIPLELHSVAPYKILINDLEYKKMTRETTGSINQLNQNRITIRELIKL